ncbi:GldG family protein, partial [Candidatus Albibeggiatoa sp. nov. BB20]|uniref:GldG family protein n=1 Tax=Candidatus Albibeggiatoa sp. nov. BB20 TaxID=3162723 RepID=UPI003365AC81
LSTQYVYQVDWTRNARHTLTAPSQAVLKQLPEPIQMTIYIENDEMSRKWIGDLIRKYQREKDNFKLRFVDPYTVPDKVKSLNVKMTPQGQLFAVLEIQYQERTETIQQLVEFLTEQEISSALQRLARNQKHKIAFLQGHGERNPQGQANHDLGLWSQELSNAGFEIQALNLSQQTDIPSDIQTLIIASPQVNLLTGEASLINQYVQQGGNLLWMLEPNESLHGLEPVAKSFNLTIAQGILVDPNSWVGANNPGMLVLPALSHITPHVILAGFQQDSLFPKTAGLQLEPSDEWEAVNLLTTAPEVWSEINELKGEVQFDEEQDVDGPLTIAIALTREIENETATEQRILILGDGDFVSNTFIGNGGNLELSLRMLNWLVQDDAFIDIPVQTTDDTKLSFSPTAFNFLAIFFVIVLPISLLITGMFVWLKRRKA